MKQIIDNLSKSLNVLPWLREYLSAMSQPSDMAIAMDSLNKAIAITNKLVKSPAYKSAMNALTGGGKRSPMMTVKGPDRRPNKPQKQKSISRAIVRAPVGLSDQLISHGPSQRALPNGGINVRHCELIAEVTGETAFTLQTFELNPGLQATFPWLAGVASRYEFYKFRNLGFMFKTSCSTATEGTLYMAADYDSSDAVPESGTEMFAMLGCVRTQPWAQTKFLCNNVGLLGGTTKKYVRSLPPEADNDLKTYDAGKLHVAVEGAAGSESWGQLYVVYDVDLMIPASFSTTEDAGQYMKFTPGGSNPLLPFATIEYAGGKTFYNTPNDNTVVFDTPGVYNICIYAFGTAINQDNPCVTLSDNSYADVIIEDWYTNAAKTFGECHVFVKVTAIGQSAEWAFDATTIASLKMICFPSSWTPVPRLIRYYAKRPEPKVPMLTVEQEMQAQYGKPPKQVPEEWLTVKTPAELRRK